jgi:hypothetical protein
MKRLITVTLAIVLLLSACGKKEVKKVTEDSTTATEAFALADVIRDAYLNKDVLVIEKNCTKEGFRAISSVVRPFDSAELSFTPVWVEIDNGVVNLNVSWNGKWRKGGKMTEERGMAVFVMKGKPLKVDAVLRANPFKYPE